MGTKTSQNLTPGIILSFLYRTNPIFTQHIHLIPHNKHKNVFNREHIPAMVLQTQFPLVARKEKV